MATGATQAMWRSQKPAKIRCTPSLLKSSKRNVKVLTINEPTGGGQEETTEMVTVVETITTADTMEVPVELVPTNQKDLDISSRTGVARETGHPADTDNGITNSELISRTASLGGKLHMAHLWTRHLSVGKIG